MSCKLEDELRAQLTAAIRAKATAKADWVRMINTEIMKRRTAAGFSGEVNDALVLDVIAAYKKQMEKARVEFQKVGERGLPQVAALDQELAWCAEMLPTAASEAELRAAVAAAVAELPSKDPKMAGRIVGAIKKQFGDRADAALAKKLAEEALA